MAGWLQRRAVRRAERRVRVRAEKAAAAERSAARWRHFDDYWRDVTLFGWQKGPSNEELKRRQDEAPYWQDCPGCKLWGYKVDPDTGTCPKCGRTPASYYQL